MAMTQAAWRPVHGHGGEGDPRCEGKPAQKQKEEAERYEESPLIMTNRHEGRIGRLPEDLQLVSNTHSEPSSEHRAKPEAPTILDIMTKPCYQDPVASEWELLQGLVTVAYS